MNFNDIATQAVVKNQLRIFATARLDFQLRVCALCVLQRQKQTYTILEFVFFGANDFDRHPVPHGSAVRWCNLAESSCLDHGPEVRLIAKIRMGKGYCGQLEVRSGHTQFLFSGSMRPVAPDRWLFSSNRISHVPSSIRVRISVVQNYLQSLLIALRGRAPSLLKAFCKEQPESHQ
ncbi:hypothetical protein D3C85_1326700 [compost metagenome]